MEFLYVFAGIAIGIIVTRLHMIFNVAGTLRVDTSDPDDPPYLFAELSIPPLEVKKKKYAIFVVNPQNYISHD